MNEKDKVKQIPLLDLKRELSSEIEEAFLREAANARYIMGPAVGQLEHDISAYLNSKYCRGVASGTDALVLSLRALAIKTKGREYFTAEDEIITTPFTFTATGGSILRTGATLVFVDIDPVSFNMDPKKVEEAITPQTVGIIPVHLYGQPWLINHLMELAAAKDLFVVEDVAQAFGATYQDKKAGTIGDLGAFADVDMISTNDSELKRLIDMLHKHGGADKYNADYIGYNSWLDTIHVAVLLVKLKHVDRLNRLRCQIAATYSSELNNLPDLEVPTGNEPGHVFHQYTVRTKSGKRYWVQQQLKEQGIATAVYYPVPLHQMKVFNNRCRISGKLTASELASAEVLSLPIEPLLTEEEVQTVIDAFKKAVN